MIRHKKSLFVSVYLTCLTLIQCLAFVHSSRLDKKDFVQSSTLDQRDCDFTTKKCINTNTTNCSGEANNFEITTTGLEFWETGDGRILSRPKRDFGGKEPIDWPKTYNAVFGVAGWVAQAGEAFSDINFHLLGYNALGKILELYQKRIG